MIRINLLPHREEARKAKRQQFYAMAGAADVYRTRNFSANVFVKMNEAVREISQPHGCCARVFARQPEKVGAFFLES